METSERPRAGVVAWSVNAVNSLGPSPPSTRVRPSVHQNAGRVSLYVELIALPALGLGCPSGMCDARGRQCLCMALCSRTRGVTGWGATSEAGRGS